MAIGRDLLDLPFAEMVRNLAIAIADGQTALDRNSLDTLRVLAETEVDVLTDVTEIIEPDIRTVNVPDPRGGPSQPVPVTGARIRASGAPPMRMNMIQAGLLPTFYQFTEATIEVRLSITMREDRETEERGQRTSPGLRLSPFLGLGYSRAYTSTVDYRTANKYSYTAQGASHLRATMRPVPPPPRLEPTFTTVNTLTQPPTITATPR
jgi:hypothetical protein